MASSLEVVEVTDWERLDALRETKLQQTREKQQVLGAMDYDDWGIVLPPVEAREVRKAMSGSGIEITDVVIQGVDIASNHPSGGWFGAEISGQNFRALLPVFLNVTVTCCSVPGC